MELTRAERALVAARMLVGLEICFAHWESVPDVDLRMVFRDFLEHAFAARDRHEFDLAALAFMARFRNGHTAFSDAWLWQVHGAALGFDARPIGDGWFVTSSAHPGLTPGSRIRAIDHCEIGAFFDIHSLRISASSPREAAWRLFTRPYLFPPRFVLTTETGRDILIVRGETARLRSSHPTSAWLVPGHLKLLRLPSFERPAYEAEAIWVVRALSPDMHLIVDARGNGGGDTPAGLVDALMDRPYRYWHATTPVYAGLSRARRDPPETRIFPPEWHQAAAGAFRGGLAILTDGGTFSAAEDFVVPFKDNGRAIVIGERSGGSSGQPYVEALGNGMQFWIGAKRQYLPDGSAFEGHGLEPDILVVSSQSDLTENHDRPLEAALRHLTGRHGRTPLS